MIKNTDADFNLPWRVKCICIINDFSFRLFPASLCLSGGGPFEKETFEMHLFYVAP